MHDVAKDRQARGPIIRAERLQPAEKIVRWTERKHLPVVTMGPVEPEMQIRDGKNAFLREKNGTAMIEPNAWTNLQTRGAFR